MKPQRIALFGGSFDPVHLGHIHIARAAVEALSLDLVIFIPCRRSPHTVCIVTGGLCTELFVLLYRRAGICT